MFGIEEKILLFDITNSYFEGKMENSELCQYGRSKEKRDDCKIVVTAKVETVDGQVISIRQSTEAESKLSAIYDLLYINPKPLGKRKSMLHPNQTSQNPSIGNQGVT